MFHLPRAIDKRMIYRRLFGSLTNNLTGISWSIGSTGCIERYLNCAPEMSGRVAVNEMVQPNRFHGEYTNMPRLSTVDPQVQIAKLSIPTHLDQGKRRWRASKRNRRFFQDVRLLAVRKCYTTKLRPEIDESNAKGS